MGEAVSLGDIAANYAKFNTGGDFSNVPAGTYTLRVARVIHKDAADKMYLNPVYVVEDGPEAGATITAGTLSYKDQENVSRTLDKLRSFGLGQDEIARIASTGGGWKEIGAALVGRVIKADLTVQGGTSQYKDRNNLPFKFDLISVPDASGAATPMAPPPAAAAPPAVTPPPPPPTAEATGGPDEPAF